MSNSMGYPTASAVFGMYGHSAGSRNRSERKVATRYLQEIEIDANVAATRQPFRRRVLRRRGGVTVQVTP